MKSIVLRKDRERSALRRHPWLFSGAIGGSGDVQGLVPGEMVAVKSSSGETLGFGWFSPQSQIRVRMLSFGGELPSDEAKLVRDRVGAAVGRRATFFANAYTNAMRLVNAESDGLPGVVADYYAGHVVCQFGTAGADRMKCEIAAALMDYAPLCAGVSERLDFASRAKEGLPTEPGFRHLLGEEPPELVEIAEGPCRFLVDVRNGHKTGFYLDQRDARAAVGMIANGREVLNCFAYTGGFGLFARNGGASKVVQVDSSAPALELAKRNEGLVHLCGTTMEYVEADVFKLLRKYRDEGRTFDMVVLDPPKFAETKGQLLRAARGYKDINLLAMKLLRPDGILATFSCSGAMDAQFFDKILAEAAQDARRDFQVVSRTRAGEDHPVALAFPEGAYLKGAILRAV